MTLGLEPLILLLWLCWQDLSQLKARLSFYLPLLFNRFRSQRRRRFFVRQWGDNGG